MVVKPPGMNWNLGLVVHDTDGHPWIYIGFRITRAGTTERIFVKSENGSQLSAPPWTYRAVHRETLIRKFPDLAEHWIDRTAIMGD